jgi:hypothetical protein
VRRASSAAALACTLVAAGCGDEPTSFAPTNVHASANSTIATVVNVDWTTAEPSIGYVSYGTTPNLGKTTAIESAKTTKHTAGLVGVSPNTTYYYRVLTWQGLDAGASPVATVTTGAAPSNLPVLTFAGDATSVNGFNELLLLPVLGQKPLISVVTSSGQYLWYYAEDKGRTVTRARFSLDGKSVLYNAIGSGTTPSEIVRVALDGSSVSSIAVPDLGRDFVQVANGDYVALVSDVRPSGTSMLRGDKLVAIDATGKLTTIISLWDCFDPAKYPGDGSNGDWTGAVAISISNSDDTDLSNDVFYLSLRNLSSVVRVPRSSGKCEAVIGAAGATINFAAGSSTFVHPGGIFGGSTKLEVFDSDGAGANTSRALEYTIDPVALTATEAFRYTPNPPIHVDALGGVSALIGNRWLANWSTAGKIEVVGLPANAPVGTTTPELRWSLTAPAGTTFGYHVRTPSLDPPINEP